MNKPRRKTQAQREAYNAYMREYQRAWRAANRDESNRQARERGARFRAKRAAERVKKEVDGHT